MVYSVTPAGAIALNAIAEIMPDKVPIANPQPFIRDQYHLNNMGKRSPDPMLMVIHPQISLIFLKTSISPNPAITMNTEAI